MSKNYDAPFSAAEKLRIALGKFQNVPEVGGVFDQQHADCLTQAGLELGEVITELDDYFNDSDTFPNGRIP